VGLQYQILIAMNLPSWFYPSSQHSSSFWDTKFCQELQPNVSHSTASNLASYKIGHNKVNVMTHHTGQKHYFAFIIAQIHLAQLRVKASKSVSIEGSSRSYLLLRPQVFTCNKAGLGLN